MQNIGGENAGDAFYRYKMPKLIAKVRQQQASGAAISKT
jgi:phosphoribulokinase